MKPFIDFFSLKILMNYLFITFLFIVLILVSAIVRLILLWALVRLSQMAGSDLSINIYKHTSELFYTCIQK